MVASLLSGYQRSQVRDYFGFALNATCHVQAVTDGVPQTWAMPGVTVDCIITDPVQGGGADEAYYDGSEPAVIIHLDATVAIKSGDRIASDGKTYKTVNVDAVRNDNLLHRLTCIEVREPGEAV